MKGSLCGADYGLHKERQPTGNLSPEQSPDLADAGLFLQVLDVLPFQQGIVE